VLYPVTIQAVKICMADLIPRPPLLNPLVTASIPVADTNKIKLTAMWAFLRLLVLRFVADL